MNDPVSLYLAARAARSIPSGLIVPSWVMKDRAFYKKMQAKGFTSQRALDNFINREAAKRAKRPVRFPVAKARDLSEFTGNILPRPKRRPQGQRNVA